MYEREGKKLKNKFIELINELRESEEDFFEENIFEFISLCTEYVKCTVEMQALELIKGDLPFDEYRDRMKELTDKEISMYHKIEDKTAVINRYCRIAGIDALFKDKGNGDVDAAEISIYVVSGFMGKQKDL